MRTFLVMTVLAAFATAADARPSYRRAVVDLLDLPAASPLNDCKVCHLPPRGKDADDMPHNAFGSRLKGIRREMTKAGKPSDIASRLLAVAAEDADGDGAANLVELIAGTFPGDGASKPSAEAVVAAKVREKALLASLAGYRWRPFARVEAPPAPAFGGDNIIDAFLEAERRAVGVVARPRADKATLLRRVTIDLTGLPPTAEELSAFVADARPDAYERLVDRLLASPRYGERWGRHWMDVWRYSDWAGFGSQIRDSLPHVRHWRDWIIESLNENKSYDRMIHEMLAADELAPGDENAIRATGFLARNYKLLSRERWLQDAVDHTSMAFLGLTTGCAKCHDHFYDPITQEEYYRLRAVFMPHKTRTDRVRGVTDLTKDGVPRVYDADLNAPTYLLVRGDDRTPGKVALPPGVPEALGGSLDVKPVTLPREAADPDGRAFVVAEDLATLRANAAKAAPADKPLAEAKIAAFVAVTKAEASGNPDDAKAAVVAQRAVAEIEARRAVDASAKDAKKLAQAKAALEKLLTAHKAPPTTAFTKRTKTAYPATSTGRRLALAKWITSRENPTAARTAVNHIWARHFGRGLAPNLADLGRNAPPPSHPALLDRLAAEFMESGWDMKRLHRLMLTSEAYRLSSTPDADAMARDRDNVRLWRFTPRRAEAEVVRDGVLFVAGAMDSTFGGPEVPYTQGLAVPRRSVYFQTAQEKQMEFLLLFDTAAVTECYQRKQAIMPQQALALMNSDFVLTNARKLSSRLSSEAGKNDTNYVEALFAAVLTRPPTSAEREECVSFLVSQPARGREMLAHVMMNHHEFATLR